MARTKRNAMNIEEARRKIQTTQLINRLTNHVLGKIDMQPSQVTAALGLLRKSLPDMQAVEHSGEVSTRYVAQVPAKAESMEEWEQTWANAANGNGAQRTQH